MEVYHNTTFWPNKKCDIAGNIWMHAIGPSCAQVWVLKGHEWNFLCFIMKKSLNGLFQKLEAPHPRRQKYVKLKIWEFPGSNFDLKKWEF